MGNFGGVLKEVCGGGGCVSRKSQKKWVKIKPNKSVLLCWWYVDSEKGIKCQQSVFLWIFL